jgi:hypothetical protein
LRRPSDAECSPGCDRQQPANGRHIYIKEKYIYKYIKLLT